MSIEATTQTENGGVAMPPQMAGGDINNGAARTDRSRSAQGLRGDALLAGPQLGRRARYPPRECVSGVGSGFNLKTGHHMTLDEMCSAIAAAGQDAMVGVPSAGNRRVVFEQAVKEVRLIRANAIKWRNFFKQTPGAAHKAKKVRHRAERRLGQFIIAMKDAVF